MPISQKEYYSSYYYGQTNTVTRRSSRTNRNSNNNMNFEQRIRPNGQSNRIFDVEKDRTVGADADIDIKETTKSSLDVLNEMNSYLEEQKRSLNGDNK